MPDGIGSGPHEARSEAVAAGRCGAPGKGSRRRVGCDWADEGGAV